MHVHDFQGGNCSAPAVCSSCGATGALGDHNWVTETIYHDATGHYEWKVTGTEEVLVEYTSIYWTIFCQVCGANVGTVYDINGPGPDEEGTHARKYNHHSFYYDGTNDIPVYETRDKWESVWVEDSQAWNENITTCSICGTRK